MTLASMREPLDVWVLEELGKLLEDLGGELDLEEAVDALGVQDHGERRPHQLLLGQAAPFAQERLQVGKVVLDLFHVHALALGRAVHAPLDGIVVEPLGIRVEVGLGPGNELGEERGPKLAVCLEHLGVPRVGDDLLDQLLARLRRRLVEVASALAGHLVRDLGGDREPVGGAGLGAGADGGCGVAGMLRRVRCVERCDLFGCATPSRRMSGPQHSAICHRRHLA